MGLFLSRLVVSPVSDGMRWVLTDPFEFHCRIDGNTHRIVVPRGFLTDFASVPLPLRLVLPPWGRYGFASVVHDWLYWEQSLPRETADVLLLEGMRTLRVRVPVRWAIYVGVRAFGASAWLRNRQERARGVLRVVSGASAERPGADSLLGTIPPPPVRGSRSHDAGVPRALATRYL